jgi:hypothetical protein
LTSDQLGTRKARLLLLGRGDVRADVGLDEKQAAEARRTLDALYDQAAALRGQKGPEALSRKRAIDQAEDEWLRTHLSEAQRKRLIEIDLQWEGPSALLTRPVVADHLDLTNEQRQHLGEAIAERNRRRSAGGDLRECENQLHRETLRILSKEQSQRWRAMLGAPCAFHRDDNRPASPATP